MQTALCPACAGEPESGFSLKSRALGVLPVYHAQQACPFSASAVRPGSVNREGPLKI
jgi:hypothetical protein